MFGDVRTVKALPLAPRNRALMVSNPGVLHQTLLQKHLLVPPRIPIDYPKHLIPQPSVEVWGLKAVGIENS
jgi:hypothetical protein